MTQTEMHLDGLLRHLGAAYYESLHGRATDADVRRALDTVEEHLAQRDPREMETKTGADDRLGRPRPARPEPPRAPRHLDPH